MCSLKYQVPGQAWHSIPPVLIEATKCANRGDVVDVNRIMVPSWVMYFDASIGLWSHLERIDPVGEYEEKSFVWVVLAVQQAQAVRSISAKTALNI